MAIHNHSLKQTLQLIVDILCFEDSPQEDLTEVLRTKSVDWEAVVKVASEHLVLPAVYCRLEQKSLLAYLPEDLVHYLSELTELNRQRNATLKKEAKAISRILKRHRIEHVFIKGMALLVANYYTDPGERMIGDIDILVASDDLDSAFGILVAEGYSQFVSHNYQVKNYRHRPRQIANHRLGAIELHDQLLKHRYNHLLDKNSFLESKVVVGEVAIPHSNGLVWNTILALQINNDHSYYGTINLKAIYDVLVMKLTQKPKLINELSKEKHSRQFLDLASLFVPSLAPNSNKRGLSPYQRVFLLTLKFPPLNRLYLKCKWIYLSVKERLHLLIFNKSYRDHIIKNKLFR